ncbi:hypothetical protein [Rouxiella badensis]|jgi:hypothetical protein|uniref:hypothetical protein n=1 Tax=Rouxiella badensis TaxID=1646377 RepID=UPI0003751BA9|nr:hypothetical protein [Rouxiella badensis]MCC3704293.1 hypothetical protein [Rouxiella badensis]MCC3720808.1 hypothetical protein [Rouxiella badensis]MCC3730647.1 hypothetical protein [Rouxiella badensis]MCC3734858.1 hypothetical protein [Rouxiella badensis]MCC3741855.1 hypothetical protein [Rouxiella badensis]
MNRQQFTPLPPLAVKACAVMLLLFVPLSILLVQGMGEKQRHQQTLDTHQALLVEHRQAAEKIYASQKAFDRRLPGKTQATPDMLPLSLIGKALREDVALVSVEVDNAQSQARLVVVTDSLNDLLDFTARLQKLAGKVELESHSSETAFKGRWQVKAALRMEYRHED